ncbi:MAG: hypothetical protein ACOC1I_03900 [Spirochaetota bacterium]
MEDYREDNISRRRQIRRNIESLQGKLKTTRNPFQQSSIAGELSKLEQERMQIDSLFEEPPVEEDADEEAPEEHYPQLNGIYQENPDLLQKSQHLERDIRASILYLDYFEREFLGMFTSRKMRLDVKYSVERDSFYDIYYQVSRSLQNYRTEADRIAAGSYTKQYEADILKRKVEMRHAVLIELDWFFRKLKRFAKELIEDIEQDELRCQNPSEPLEYTSLDGERLLRGQTVEEGIRMLYEYVSEAVDYLEIPEFQQRPL